MDGISIDREALVQSVNFHGQQLLKICEGSSKLNDPLNKINPASINYKEYNARQKYLNFQDRGKRLRLQEFIVKNSVTLFDETFTAPIPESRLKVPVDESFFAAVPPFEGFCNADKESKIKRFFETTKVGDTLICQVSNKQTVIGVKLLIVEGDKPHVVADLGIKAVLPLTSINSTRPLLMGDYVRATVLEIVPEADKLVIGQAVLFTDPMPSILKKATQDARNESYDNLLHKNVGFNNPGNIGYLGGLLGIGNENHSNIEGLRGRFPVEEYASELRQLQAAKWAFKSVAEGIEHFKGGRHSEAFQCLNKALNVDPRNVEGLVARGALYANSGSFQKAIEDFEMALKVNPNHQNARKYMGETLVALGRSYEEKNQMEDAMSAYQHCLVLLPYHEEAQNSIEFLRSKNLIVPKEEVEDHKEKKSKKEKKKKSKKKRHGSSSGSSSSSSSSSSDSSSESSSSSGSSSGSSQSSHSRSRRKKSKKNKKERKEKSLSPLSKRMQLMDSGAEMEGTQRNQCNPASLPRTPIDKETEYEMRVRAFLEQTKGDSDYEEKVRKFLAEAARFKMDRKSEEKSKKKKKKDKKERKEKEKNKKRKREDKDEKKRRKRSKKDKMHEGLEEDDDDMETARLREALRKELSMKQELRRRVGVHDDGQGYDKRLSANHDEEIPVKLGGYYFKPKDGPKKYDDKRMDERRRSIDKFKLSPKMYRTKSEEREDKRDKKQIDIFEDSPPKNKTKFQIGPVGVSSRYQGKKDHDKPSWDDLDDKRMMYGKDDMKKTNGDERKQLRPMSPGDRIPLPRDKPKSPPLPPPPAEPIKTAVDKFSFRVKVIDPPLPKPNKRSASTGSSGSDDRKKKRRDSSGSSSRKQSPGSSRGRRSRSRSFNKYGSRSRSRSYRSSRSRSRSYDKYSRSRSRSPRRSSRSPRRHPQRFRGHNRGGGTYYKPRFQNNPNQYRNQRGRDNYNNNRGRGGYYNNRYDNRYDNRFDRGRGRGGYTPRGNIRGRGRYFHNNRPQHYNDNRRRYYDEDRRRSRDRSRSGSYEEREDDPMRKVGAAKDKIDKYIEMEEKSEPRRRDEPLSEGEAPDSPPRKPDGPPLPPDNPEDDKFKKGAKKEDSKERKDLD